MPLIDYIPKEAVIQAIRDVFCRNCNSYNGAMCRACEHQDDIDIIDDYPASFTTETTSDGGGAK